MNILNQVVYEANNATDAGAGLRAKPMFPHTIDSTILAAFRSCPQKAFRQYVQHWKPQTESVHLVAGGAFATGIEKARRAFFEGLQTPIEMVYDRNKARNVAKWGDAVHVPGLAGDSATAQALGLQALLAHYGDFDCPPDSAKSPERMAGALEFYFERYPLGEDQMLPIQLPSDKSGIEFSFAIPLGINHPVSGDPILYTGRADMVSNYADGIFIVDEKTTSSLGASWASQWDLRSQFTGYTYAARELGIPANGCIVRGVSILKTKYDTQQVMTYRSDYELKRWFEQVHRDIERMIRCWNDGWWDYSLDTACTEYGGCALARVCKSEDPESWLPMYFEQRVWDPLARRELTVAEWEAEWNHVS